MSQSIETVLTEDRSFPPSEEFRGAARLADRSTYEQSWRRSIEDPDGFFGEVARELPWLEPFTSVLDWSGAPVARWFEGGKLNVSHVCLDQHVEAGRGGEVALVWEGEPGDERTFTYGELLTEVC
ncbi:MAG: acetyl-coenzyme A synthetase N-terminal domain-containing protein, partial [Planctomycetota bacterium]